MERKALGRGLASLISGGAIRPQEVSPMKPSSGFAQIPLDKIFPNPKQPRKIFDAKKIEELAQSIKERGILVPLIVAEKEGGYELISGERRWRAARQLALQEVPVLIRGVGTPENLELALIENIQREDLSPIEEALAYQALIEEYHYSQEEAAQKVGKDRATVANLIRLLKLPTKVKEALEEGKISMGHARALLSVEEIERQLYFVEKVEEEGWSVRELEGRIAARRTIGLKSPVKKLKPLSPHLIEILDQIRRVLGTQVRVLPAAGKKNQPLGSSGKILIDYYSEDDLDRIYRIITRK